jgi:hypothetical protein
VVGIVWIICKLRIDVGMEDVVRRFSLRMLQPTLRRCIAVSFDGSGSTRGQIERLSFWRVSLGYNSGEANGPQCARTMSCKVFFRPDGSSEVRPKVRFRALAIMFSASFDSTDV